MDKERNLKSFDLADGTVKHLLGLATASIGGTIALFDSTGPGLDFGVHAPSVKWGIIWLVVSIFWGLCALLNLIGLLGNKAITEPTVYKPSVQTFVSAQLLFFLIGMLVLATAAFSRGEAQPACKQQRPSPATASQPPQGVQNSGGRHCARPRQPRPAPASAPR